MSPSENIARLASELPPITLDEMKGIDRIIGVAGGAKKAKAILSVIRNIKNTILVTDESAANEMCSLLGLNI